MNNNIQTSGSTNNIPYIDSRFNYLDMYNWTNDLPLNENSKQIFEDVIEYFNTKRIRNPQILEIGTYVGVSLIKIMERIPDSHGTVIDMWTDYKEYCGENIVNSLNNITANKAEEVFHQNIKTAGLENRVTAIKGCSYDILLDLLKANKKYDFIYVDGSHTLLESYIDIIVSWKLLKPNGILVIDDVPYNKDKVLDSPYQGVVKFINDYRDQMNIIKLSYRVFIEKKLHI